MKQRNRDQENEDWFYWCYWKDISLVPRSNPDNSNLQSWTLNGVQSIKQINKAIPRLGNKSVMPYGVKEI